MMMIMQGEWRPYHGFVIVWWQPNVKGCVKGRKKRTGLIGLVVSCRVSFVFENGVKRKISGR